MNDSIRTKPSIKTFTIKIRIKLESLVCVSTAEVEICGSEYENTLVLREQPLKKIHTFLDEVNRVNKLT